MRELEHLAARRDREDADRLPPGPRLANRSCLTQPRSESCSTATAEFARAARRRWLRLRPTLDPDQRVGLANPEGGGVLVTIAQDRQRLPSGGPARCRRARGFAWRRYSSDGSRWRRGMPRASARLCAARHGESAARAVAYGELADGLLVVSGKPCRRVSGRSGQAREWPCSQDISGA